MSAVLPNGYTFSNSVINMNNNDANKLRHRTVCQSICGVLAYLKCRAYSEMTCVV